MFTALIAVFIVNVIQTALCLPRLDIQYDADNDKDSKFDTYISFCNLNDEEGSSANNYYNNKVCRYIRDVAAAKDLLISLDSNNLNNVQQRGYENQWAGDNSGYSDESNLVKQKKFLRAPFFDIFKTIYSIYKKCKNNKCENIPEPVLTDNGPESPYEVDTTEDVHQHRDFGHIKEKLENYFNGDESEEDDNEHYNYSEEKKTKNNKYNIKSVHKNNNKISIDKEKEHSLGPFNRKYKKNVQIDFDSEIFRNLIIDKQGIIFDIVKYWLESLRKSVHKLTDKYILKRRN